MAAKIKTLNVWIELCYDNEADEVPEEILVTVNSRKQKWDDCGSTLMSDEEFITLFPRTIQLKRAGIFNC